MQNCYPFSKFNGRVSERRSRIRASVSPLTKCALFRAKKMGTNMDIRFDRGGGGGGGGVLIRIQSIC